MAKYKKKPVEIEAIQWKGDNIDEIEKFVTVEIIFFENEEIKIPTLEGVMTASKGDFIIRGISGEFYPCKPDIFYATYDLVE